MSHDPKVMKLTFKSQELIGIYAHTNTHPHVDTNYTIRNSIYKDYCISLLDILFQPFRFTSHSVFFVCLKVRSLWFFLNKNLYSFSFFTEDVWKLFFKRKKKREKIKKVSNVVLVDQSQGWNTNTFSVCFRSSFPTPPVYGMTSLLRAVEPT